ncbi:MAG: tRNA (adenosine(37)-N6)-dimethylallyltransferase MiaA [Oscillospiraceae bacterium]|nr:tRNA (adenosine(37)-N6)-dimethylallyltransferase MiaA [Oscillospiraceae bacterium]
MTNIICVVGPTASGKTGLSIALAKEYDAEILSCDSMQIYRHMDIGTAKPTAEEMDGIVHHMIDVAEPTESFSVSRYVEMADPIVQDILRRGKRCIIVGGTGLYVDSLIAGRTFAPYPETGKRQELEAMAEEKGMAHMRAYLRTFDPESAERLQDLRRIIRACEVYLETGKTITQHNKETAALPPKYTPLWLGLDFTDRAQLYSRIDRRVDIMFRDGLVEEIRGLLEKGLSPTATGLQAIGYKEPLAALRGEMTMDEAADKIKLETRRYAKRQLTWFRRNKDIRWIRQQEPVSLQAAMEQARTALSTAF